MQLKRSFVFTVFFILMLSFMSASYGADIRAVPGPGIKTAQADLKKTFPKFSFSALRETPIKGIYEVDMGAQVIYFSPKGYLFFGDLYSKAGINLTAQRKQDLMADVAKNLPLDKAIKIGSGKKTVVEFADPVCPFCRKAYDYLAGRKDITLYVYLFPLTQIHPQAMALSKYILCSADPGQAYDRVMRGKMDGKNVSNSANCDRGNILSEDMKIARKVGVMGTPAFFINGKFINGANFPLIDKILSD